MTFLHFAVLALATYRLSRLLAFDQGPGRVFLKLREAVVVRYDENGEPENALGQLLKCPWCLSPWIGLFLLALYLLSQPLALLSALPLALSGAAGLLWELETFMRGDYG